MRALIKCVGMMALLGNPLFGIADSSVQSVTVGSVGILSSDAWTPEGSPPSNQPPSAYVQIQLANNQAMTDCAFNAIYLSNMNDAYQKQAYATLLTAKINGLVLSLVAYKVVSTGKCELTVVQL